MTANRIASFFRHGRSVGQREVGTAGAAAIVAGLTSGESLHLVEPDERELTLAAVGDDRYLLSAVPRAHKSSELVLRTNGRPEEEMEEVVIVLGGQPVVARRCALVPSALATSVLSHWLQHGDCDDTVAWLNGWEALPR